MWWYVTHKGKSATKYGKEIYGVDTGIVTKSNSVGTFDIGYGMISTVEG